MSAQPSTTGTTARVETVRFEPRGWSITPSEWEQRVDTTRRALADDGFGDDGLRDVLRTIWFTGGPGVWHYDASQWWMWRGSTWAPATPPQQLTIRSFTMDYAIVDERPAAIPVRETRYRATHIVPPGGLDTWARPDTNSTASGRLHPGLDVAVEHWHATGWAQIRCSNGWTGWVDGRQLTPADLAR
jgi:hypothetical protein